MKGDTIYRQDAIDALSTPHGILYPIRTIESLPAAQPERKKGRWVEVTDGICIWKVCDQCGEKPLWNEWRTDRCESNFCTNCGADMRGGQDD